MGDPVPFHRERKLRLPGRDQMLSSQGKKQQQHRCSVFSKKGKKKLFFLHGEFGTWIKRQSNSTHCSNTQKFFLLIVWSFFVVVFLQIPIFFLHLICSMDIFNHWTLFFCKLLSKSTCSYIMCIFFNLILWRLSEDSTSFLSENLIIKPILPLWQSKLGMKRCRDVFDNHIYLI